MMLLRVMMLMFTACTIPVAAAAAAGNATRHDVDLVTKDRKAVHGTRSNGLDVTGGGKLRR